MAFQRSERLLWRMVSPQGILQISFLALLTHAAINTDMGPIGDLDLLTHFFLSSPQELRTISETEIVNSDKNSNSDPVTANNDTPSEFFSIPIGFENRVAFWVDIYAKYTAEDAVFHDSQNLSVIYKVVDLRPIMNSNLHPFVKEFKANQLITKERRQLIAQLTSLRKKIGKPDLTEEEQKLFNLLGQPKTKSVVTEAIGNVRMQLGQKSFVEKALISSDLYLPAMEKIFEEKGLPKELTRMPFVESSFNLAARSKVGASGIWQIMPATGRKLIPNSIVDYRNDPIKATEFAASLLQFNFKILKKWPLAVTAYNHGATGLSKLTKRYKTDDLATIIERAYGSHAFAFASSNFYACFLAILQIEKKRGEYFPEVPRGQPLEFAAIQLKKPIKYRQLIEWFNHDLDKAELFNPHLSGSAKRGLAVIPKGTLLYIPPELPTPEDKSFPLLAKKI